MHIEGTQECRILVRIGSSICGSGRLLSAITWFNPYIWQLSNQFNWHDKAMIFEHYHWKKAKAKKQRYKFKWNEYMDKDHRDSYYFNWPVYFP